MMSHFHYCQICHKDIPCLTPDCKDPHCGVCPDCAVKGKHYMGRRVYSDDSALVLEAGTYGQDSHGQWMGHTPNGLVANLSKHTITEHADGTITVSPSILVRQGKDGRNGSWHGYLEKGIWREV